jgi:hypothetical protein
MESSMVPRDMRRKSVQPACVLVSELLARREGCEPLSAVWLKQNCGVRRGCGEGFDILGGEEEGEEGGGEAVFQK